MLGLRQPLDYAYLSKMKSQNYVTLLPTTYYARGGWGVGSQV